MLHFIKSFRIIWESYMSCCFPGFCQLLVKIVSAQAFLKKLCFFKYHYSVTTGLYHNVIILVYNFRPVLRGFISPQLFIFIYGDTAHIPTVESAVKIDCRIQWTPHLFCHYECCPVHACKNISIFCIMVMAILMVLFYEASLVSLFYLYPD